MNKKTIFISLVLALIFAFTSVNADTPGIRDLDKSSSYAKEAIVALAEKEIVKGDNLGNFEPTKPITRAEFVTLMVRVLNLDTTNVPETATFKDVPTTHWAFKYVEAARKAGIVNGVSPTEFGVSQVSTREQMAVMFVRALELMNPSEPIPMLNINTLSDKDKISSWAKREVDIAMTAGLMNGVSKTSFAPKQNATKEQTAVVIDRFMGNEAVIADKVETAYGLNVEHKYPNLYSALKKGAYQDYIGDMYMTMNVDLKDLSTQDYMKTYIDIFGRFNNAAAQYDSYTKLEISGEDPFEVDSQIIVAGDKVYEKDYDGKWFVYGKADWESAGGLGMGDPLTSSMGSNTLVSADMLNSYDMLPIQEAGTVTIDGVTAEKYVINLDSEGMKYLMSEEQYNEVKDLLAEIYNGTDKYTIEFYVADGNLVKEVINSSATISDETNGSVAVQMSIDIAFKNIGISNKITLPQASDIKPLEE